MALTRITRGVIKPNENYDTHNIVSTGIVTSVGLDVNGNADISGSLSVGGVLTYEDVTSIDSVGIITARTGLVSPYADIDDFVSVGNNIHLGNAGVITATSFVGSGAALTGIDATAIKDSGGNVKIQAQASGAIHTGVSTFQDLDVDGHTELDNVNVAGVTTFNEDISFKGANFDFLYDRSLNTLKFDQGIAAFGTSGQMTLQNQIIRGVTNIRAGGLYIQNLSNQQMISCYTGGRIELYFNNSKKLDTTNTGIDITGNVVGDGLTIDGDSDLNGDLDVDGHTNLDNLNIAGVTTTTGNVNVGGYVVSQGTSGRGGIFGQVEVGYDSTYLTIQPTSGHNDLHLNYDNGSTVQIGHTNGSTLTVNGNIKPKTDSASDLGLTGTRFRAAYVDTYYGDGSNLTGITQTTINNNADNRIITGSGSANTLEAEANFTFSGSKAIMKHGATTTVSDRGLMLQASSSLTNGQVLPGITLNPNTNVDRPRAGIAGVGHGSSNGTAGMHLIFMTAYRDDGSQLTSSDERLRITSDGRVYIGATSGGNADNDDLVISGSGKKGITICSTDGSETRLVFADGLSGTNAVVGQVLYDHSANRMDFYTSTSRRVSIDNSSRLMVGTIIEGHENADTLTLSNSGTAGMTIRSTSSNCHIYFSDATSGAGEYVGQLGYNHGSDYMFFHTGGSERLRADSSGITVTGTVDSASDVILKENIKTIDNALDKVTKLRGVEYDYKENKKHSIGVIAQEVEEVLPELVNGSEQKSVAYGNIAAVLIEAIKEQNEVINKMKKEIEDLKG